MTIKAVEWALTREGISSTAKLVLVMLCDCINAADEAAYPSQRRIAEVVGISERQVRTHIKTLVEASLIGVAPSAGAGRGLGRTSARYVIACDHRTGADRDLSPRLIAQCGSLTRGSKLPPVSDNTTGRPLPPVNDIAGSRLPPVSVTGGSFPSLQPEVFGNAYIDEPEKEPERLPSSEKANHPSLASGKPKPSAEKLDGRRAIELYNEAATRCGWCLAKGQPSAQRKQAIKARLREHGMEGWAEQLAIAEEMPFLRGDNDRGWRMGIDYFARASGWSKIAEGAFQRTAKRVNGAALSEDDRHRAARSYFEKRGKWPQGYTPQPEQQR